MKAKLFTRRFQKDNQDILCDSHTPTHTPTHTHTHIYIYIYMYVYIYIYIYICNKDSMHLILSIISIKWSFWAIRIKSAFLKNKNINNGF